MKFRNSIQHTRFPEIKCIEPNPDENELAILVNNSFHNLDEKEKHQVVNELYSLADYMYCYEIELIDGVDFIRLHVRNDQICFPPSLDLEHWATRGQITKYHVKSTIQQEVLKDGQEISRDELFLLTSLQYASLLEQLQSFLGIRSAANTLKSYIQEAVNDLKAEGAIKLGTLENDENYLIAKSD